MSVNVTRSKKKRTSKKTKKSWRKNCDVDDVESFLQDQRVQEATGGLAVDKADEQLFYFDTKTKSALDSGDAKAGRKRQPKPLKCHAALNPDPMIPPARTCHNERKCKTETLKSVRKTKSDVVKHEAPAKRPAASKNEAVTKTAFDLWGSQDINKPDDGLDEHYLTVCKKKRVKPPSHYYTKPSELPAVEVPLAGASYRPVDEDYKELLRKAIAVEKKKVIAELRLKRALDDKFPKAGDAPNENTWLEEWESSGLFDDDDEQPTSAENADNDESHAVKLSNNPPVRRENKKTEKERRRLKAAKLVEREAAQKKLDRIREHNTLRMKSIKKEVMHRELALAARRTRRQLDNEQKKGKVTHRLGKVKYEEPNLEIKLSNELPDSLRLLKPEGNLLVDRFKSIQKRNLIEPRQRAKVVIKYKPKAFEKKSHRVT